MKFMWKKHTVKLINFTIRGDERGSLIALEGCSDQVPFDIKRVYYIFGTKPNVVRGKHAHYNLKQVLICVSGWCDIDIEDDTTKTTISLSKPFQGLYLEGMVWHEMKNFSPDCVLMVLASEHYDEKDYVRDYAKFLQEIHQ